MASLVDIVGADTVKKPFLDQQKKQWEVLIARGRTAGARKDFDSVIEYFEAAHKVSRNFSKRDPIRRDSALYLAYAKFCSSDKTDAIVYLQEYLSHPATLDNTEKQVADAEMMLGHCYWASDNAQAEEHFQKAFDIQQRLGLPTLEADTMLGSIRMLSKDYSGAMPSLESAYNAQKNQDKEAAQSLAVQLAYAHKELGDKSGETRWQKENLRYRIPTSSFKDQNNLEIRADVPDGWGSDSLSYFLESSQQNELATFVKLNDKYKYLQKISERFIDNRRNLVLAIMPTITERYDDVDFDQLKMEPKDWLDVFFYLRTESAFLGAVKLALSAQIPEMYMLLRGVLENAMYGFFVKKNPDKKDVWLARDESPQAKSAAKQVFKVSNMYLAIESVDAALKDDVYNLYNDTIDMGAHPNVKTFIDHSDQKNENGALSLTVSTLNPGQLEQALNDVVATGDLVFRLFKAMYPELID